MIIGLIFQTEKTFDLVWAVSLCICKVTFSTDESAERKIAKIFTSLPPSLSFVMEQFVPFAPL